jgi:hypothetical protein
MSVACCVLSIVAILPQIESRSKYGFRGKLATVSSDSVAVANLGDAVVIQFNRDAAAGPALFPLTNDRPCFPPEFASVPRPFDDGWAEYEKRIGLRTSGREMAHGLPAWLEASCANETHVRQLRPKEIFIQCWGNVSTDLTWDSDGVPHLYIPFDDGWEGFDRALWESFRTEPLECYEEFEKRLGFESAIRETQEPLMWLLRAGRTDGFQIRPTPTRHSPFETKWVGADAALFTLFDDGWEGFDRALWENLGSMPHEWDDRSAWEKLGYVSKECYDLSDKLIF